MNFKMKLAREKARVFYAKTKKETLKICFAVVLTELVAVICIAISLQMGILDLFKPKVIYIENAQAKETAKQAVEEPKDQSLEELKDYVWLKESTRGKNNYSKCKEIGEYNEIGYGISGNGNYICFDSREEQFKTLETWLSKKLAQGYTEKETLCIYNTGKTSNGECEYINMLGV